MNPAPQPTLPSILITGFDGSEDCLALAAGLLRHGLAVCAACPPKSAEAQGAAREAGCAVLVAEEGSALRAGIERFVEETPGLAGLVTVDAEQGYSLPEVLAVAFVFAANPDKVAVASRKANKRLRGLARIERGLAGLAFSVVHGRRISDPWAGLIGLPGAHAQEFLKEKGAGAAYRFRLMLTMQRHGVKAVSVPVSAPYQRERGATDKDRLADLMRIVLVPMMFVASSLMLTLSDYSMRFLFYYVILHGNEPVSLAIGRYSGALVGYLINRNVVFRRSNDSFRTELVTILKYTVLTTCNYYVSHLLISFFMSSFGLAFALASPIADVLLYAPNFLIQRDIVFRRKRTGG